MNHPVRTDEIEVDLLHLFDLLRRRAWIIVLSMILSAALLVSGALLFVTPQYRSAVMLYADGRSVSAESPAEVTAADLAAAGTLRDLSVEILKTRTTLEEVIGRAELDCTYEELYSRITAGSAGGTGIFSVTVTGTDPGETKIIADTIAEVLPSRVSDIVAGSSVRLVDPAVCASERSGPDYSGYAAAGMLLGLFTGCAVIFLLERRNTTVRGEDELVRRYGDLPVLAVVPEVPDGSGTIPEPFEGDAAEAHRKLRTLLFLRCADRTGCRVIGITGAMPREGKSRTAFCLACAVQRTGKKVLLIDADLRGSGLSDALGLHGVPGLSEVLTGEYRGKCTVQHVSPDNLPVLCRGTDLPAAPADLLASERTALLFGTLRERYDYILVDLPAVPDAADAAIVSSCTDGILCVVRQDHTDRRLLDDTVRQLTQCGANILGFVVNGSRKENARRRNRKERRTHSALRKQS